MLFFSLLCLLKAASPSLDMEQVSGNIYRTTNPPQIAAFADSKDLAQTCAGILYKNEKTNKTLEINGLIGSFYIKQAYQTHAGWIVRHSRSNRQTDQEFSSYIVSIATSWDQLKTTINETLANYMRDYTIAFPAKPTALPMSVLPSRQEIQETLGQFIESVQKSTLHNNKEIEKKMKQLENSCLKINTVYKPEGQYILPIRPSGTDGLTGLPRIVKETTGITAAEEREKKFYEILGRSEIYEIMPNGDWGGNNCIFAAIEHHREVIEEIVAYFGQAEKLSAAAVDGKKLRDIICQWILQNMDHVLFKAVTTDGREKGGMPELTVKDVVLSIGLNRYNFDPSQYIMGLRGGTQVIDEEISVIISVLIDRPIIVTTEAERGLLTSRIAETFVSRKEWTKKPIYLHNNSQVSNASRYSGSHYSGLRFVSFHNVTT